jgi:6-phospho-3-hexuloisomerase
VSNTQELALAATHELAGVLAHIPSQVFEVMCDELERAHRIACYGVGREGLMMRALTMRLYHLGLDAHVIGDMTTPPLTTGDLLVVSAGPGQFSTVAALMEVARRAGARTLVVTARPAGDAGRNADVIIHLPAQTMADDQHSSPSVLPMGSLYEAVQLLFFDVVSIRLRERLGMEPAVMRSRHTNLE